jgi:uncharacterized membrane protein YphA (DoxX/SURF4 family)
MKFLLPAFVSLLFLFFYTFATLVYSDVTLLGVKLFEGTLLLLFNLLAVVVSGYIFVKLSRRKSGEKDYSVGDSER